ncbi:MAG: phytanoyl-CoA dioxygenase family protein [Sneathiellales bacterium]|nr:phytanoyl-CoA dioxygenase family protein [Sneathiellales bacterium]
MTAEQQRKISAESHAAIMADYSKTGEDIAKNLGNRGPVKLDPSGKLAPEILEAYWRTGFYVFEGVICPLELENLRKDVDKILARAPVSPDATVDKDGKPALNTEVTRPPYRFAKPLSDPLGGTSLNNGRHPVAMTSPTAKDPSVQWTVNMLDGNLHLMDSALRLYGHPDLLSIAEAINGPDFVPYNEVAFIKEPGLGPSVAWHQDGMTHWDAEDWNEGAHGFNFMTQLYPSTAQNAVWVLPGSHKLGKVDITALVEESGNERLNGACPMICDAGEVMVMNRQLVHGSFANSSADRRVTLNAGFFPRKRVVNVTAKRLNGDIETYDLNRVVARSRIIALAVDARQQRYPKERCYQYQPLKDEQEAISWNEETRGSMLKDYNLKDMFI